jgi:hypothetical protein
VDSGKEALMGARMALDVAGVDAAYEQASRLHELFAGDDEHHGTYDPARLHLVDGKMEMKDDKGNGARTVAGSPGIEEWRRHLEGSRPLGVRPLRGDGMCRWGVIDVDQYDINHSDLAALVAREGLPLVTCRSKSGGAHLFLFLAEWAPAKQVNGALRTFAARLRLPPKVEIFPPPADPETGSTCRILGATRPTGLPRRQEDWR